jgi:serpin B
MALAGARGDTEAEMAKVLGLELPHAEMNAANTAVMASLNKASSPTFQLRTANALMLAKEGDAISADYVAMLRQDYAADVFRGSSVAPVNAWVREKTAGKIDAILDHLDPMTVLVLVNAIYFKAPWQKAFDPKLTTSETFHLLEGEAKVPMMFRRGDFAFAKRPEYRAISLPYTDRRVSMVVVLPDTGIAEIVQHLDGDEMRALLAALHRQGQEVDLSLPRFKANFAANLVPPFMAMGMHRAFDLHTADFSGMTGKPQSAFPLALSQIAHRAVIEVTEQGTEAAAATGIGPTTSAVHPSPEQFRVDRPFLFAIVDDDTGAILFEGLIADPRQAS